MTLREKLTAVPEAGIVLEAARPHPQEAAYERLRTLCGSRPKGSDLDWNRVLHLSVGAKAIPLVARNLQRAADSQLPDDIRLDLRRRTDTIGRRNLMLTAELARLVRRFEDAGIPVTSFKGPLLAERLYGTYALRQFSDLDLLVSPEDFPGAVELMRSDGYTQRRPEGTFNSDQVRAMVRMLDLYHFGFVNKATQTPVELHWRLMRRSSFPQSDVLASRTVLTSVGGVSIRTLAPEALIVYLCVHGNKHNWHRLSWVCDVAAFVHRYREIDWAGAWDLAQQVGAARRLCLGIYLASHLFDAPVPEHMDDKIVARAARLQELALDCRMLQPADTAVAQRHYPRSQINTLERWSDKLRFTAYFLTAPKQEDMLREAPPARLFLLYYLYRPLRLIRKNARRAIGRVLPG